MAKQTATKKRKPRFSAKRGDHSRDKLIAAAIELIDERERTL